MTHKSKFTAVLLISFVFLFSVSQLGLKLWTDTFDLIGLDSIMEIDIDTYFINTGYVYIWSGEGKFLLPPSENAENKSISIYIMKDDKLIKNKIGTDILLVQKNDTVYFTLRNPELD